MTITIVGSSEGRAGSGRIRNQGGVPVFEESYTYIVLGDSVNNTRLDILNTAGLPRIGVTMGPSGFTLCKAISCERRAAATLYWDITADFSSEVEEGDQDPGSDPNVWVPVRETKFERLQEVVSKDFSGAAIANSAGQAFEQGLTISRFIPVWEFFQFEAASVSDETIIDRNEVVNSATFKGRAAKTLLCTVLSSVLGFYYGQPRRLTQYQLKYNFRDWQHKRLDVGTQYKSGTTLLTFTDDSDPAQVMLGSLNGSGAKQTAGTAPAIQTFDMYATNTLSFLRI